jgi:hypothetical protein
VGPGEAAVEVREQRGHKGQECASVVVRGHRGDLVQADVRRCRPKNVCPFDRSAHVPLCHDAEDSRLNETGDRL